MSHKQILTIAAVSFVTLAIVNRVGFLKTLAAN